MPETAAETEEHAEAVILRTEYVSMTEDSIDLKAIERAGSILKDGGLVAFPTETVYGLGGDALNPQSSMKIYAAKGRPTRSAGGSAQACGRFLAGTDDDDLLQERQSAI